jgi:ABC-2 type transport system permease protein
MPWIFYAISTLLPATYFVELMRAIILRGATIYDFWMNLVVLGAMGGALFVLCALRYRRNVG